MNIYLIIAALCTLIVHCSGGRIGRKKASTSLNKIECEYDNDVCNKGYCQLKAISRGKSWLHFGCVTNYPLYDIKLHVKHSVKTSKNIFMPGFFDATFDGCQFSSVVDNVLFAKLIPNARELLDHYNHPCPFVGDTSLNLTVDGSNFPPFFQAGFFKIEFEFYTNNSNKHYSLLRTFGQVINPDWN